MLTQCGHCRAVFRVRAAHLVVARGHVECGACGLVFNALDRLGDEPPNLPLAAAAPAQTPAIAIEPLPAALRDTTEPTLAGPALLNPPPGPDAAEQAERKQRRASLRAERRWGSIARFLLLLFAAQVAWAARESIWARFPVLVPPVRVQCEQWDCAALLKLPVPRVVLMDATLRLHPTREDALLWNGTLHNQESMPAPWPNLELRLEREDGSLVAARQFAPRDYLAGEARPGELAPGARALVVLELRKPATATHYRAVLH